MAQFAFGDPGPQFAGLVIKLLADDFVNGSLRVELKCTRRLVGVILHIEILDPSEMP